MNNNRLEKLVELARITKDTPYALKSYLTTWDNTQKKFVPLELFPDQLELIKDYESYNENLADKYRQAGVTTVTAAWCSKKLVLATKDTPERVLIAANKQETAIEMANKIKAFTEQWPNWIFDGFDATKNSQKHYKLKNGSEVKAIASSKDALRGYTPTILVVDEAAYVEAGDDFWAAAMAALSTGGKIILVSTPNGHDPIYHAVYSQSLKGMNNFKITSLRWYRDPRYTKDIRWLKVDDIVHYMLNRDDYNDDEITVYETDVNKFDRLIDEGYKPISSWYEMMAGKLKFDRRKISQELECDFLGSGDYVIPIEVRDNIVKNMLREPIEKYMSNQLWQWAEPVPGHRYIMGLDISRGDSEDNSAMNIIDFDSGEQVVEWIGKLPPDDVANVAYKWGILYDAFIVVDITGGMGVATSRKLQELGYKNMYVDGINLKNVWEYNPKIAEKIPGINFNNKRTLIVASFEENLRHGFKIRSHRISDELNTFVFVNGRPDHMKGAHDDGIMSIAMPMYVGEISFGQLIRNDNLNKAMLESVILNERTYNPQKSIYSYGTTLDPIAGMFMGNNNLANPFTSNPTAEQYNEFSWLFSKRKK